MSDIISTRDKATFGEIANHYHSNRLLFGIKYSKQWILERLAYSIPVNSWRVKMHRMRCKYWEECVHWLQGAFR